MNISFDFSGKRVLVTGASRGIGLGIARGFAAAGAELIILSDDAGVEAAAQSLPGRVQSIQCDISDRAQVAEKLSAVGPLDVLINNAGMERPTPLSGPSPQTDDTFERILSINVNGTQNVTRTLVNRIRDGGRIILTSSIWGKTAVPDFSAYVSSKHALIGLMRTWTQELGPRGICVNAVCPGWVRTEAAMASLQAMAQSSGRDESELQAEILSAQAMPGLMTPDDIAGLYLFLASDAAANITGQAINIDRGEVMT